MPRSLRLSDELRAHIVQWARVGYPQETCGVLVGAPYAEETRVVWVRRATNLNRERARDRYELDPANLLCADQEARNAGLDVVGIWHTHPDHPARPSETDCAQAWPGWSYVIVSVSAEGVDDLRAWRLDGAQQFEEERIVA